MGKAPKDAAAILPGRRFRSPKETFAVVRRDRSGNVLLRDGDGSEDWVRIVAMESMIARKHLTPIGSNDHDGNHDRPERDAPEGSASPVHPGGSDVPSLGQREGQLSLGL